MSCNESEEAAAIRLEQEEILALGIVHTSTDGTSVTVDNSRVARSYREAQLNNLEAIACGRVRPPCMTAVTMFRG